MNSKVYCPNSHELAATTTNKGTCNECKTQLKNNGGALPNAECRKCDFDLCDPCYARAREGMSMDYMNKTPKKAKIILPDSYSKRYSTIDAVPNLVAKYIKILELMVNSIKAAEGTQNFEKTSEYEKQFGKEAFMHYFSDNKQIWSEFKTLAKQKGLFLNYARKEIPKILASSKDPIFTMEDIPGGDITQKSCPNWPNKFEVTSDTPEMVGDKIHNYMAQTILPKVETLLKGKFGSSKIAMAPVKGFERIVEKIKVEGKKPHTLLDYVRGSYIADTPEEMASVVKRLKTIHTEDPNIVLKRLKNGFRGFAKGNPEVDEYPRILVNLMVFKETIIELQICLASLKKFGKADHIFYELNRRETAHSLFYGEGDE